jgi:UTP--glucose-1-phosphate uridylyltransferase
MSEPRLIRKCVVPVAGLGTRLLPATKAIPKEVLPIVDTPTLQYIAQKAASAGIEDVILINGRGKASIEDDSDLALELEAILKARGKGEELRRLRDISNLANIVSVREKEPLGLGQVGGT